MFIPFSHIFFRNNVQLNQSINKKLNPQYLREARQFTETCRWPVKAINLESKGERITYEELEGEMHRTLRMLLQRSSVSYICVSFYSLSESTITDQKSSKPAEKAFHSQFYQLSFRLLIAWNFFFSILISFVMSLFSFLSTTEPVFFLFFCVLSAF